MASKISNIVEFNDTEYDLNDKEDVIELFHDLIYIINILRCDRDELRHDVDYIAERTTFSDDY